jgi:YidC/Oxa1 family membrane protein insertase
VHLILAVSWLQPIVDFLSWVVLTIDKPIHNLGWSLVILAALIRLLFWPLNTMQFKAFLSMQKIAPQIKKLQDRYKDDRQRLQAETMALYKENHVNPFAGCWPMLFQYPVIISVYYVVMNHKALFDNQNWAWIGSAITHTASASVAACQHVSISSGCIFGRPILAPSLANPDFILILLYALSMYLSVRYVSMPATDPQQAQTQRMMAFISPVMLGFFGLKYGWPSAMVLYWFAYNVFTMAQQLYLLRRYHQPLALIDSEHVLTETVTGGGASPKALTKASASGNGVAKPKPAQSGRSKRKNKRGA